MKVLRRILLIMLCLFSFVFADAQYSNTSLGSVDPSKATTGINDIRPAFINSLIHYPNPFDQTFIIEYNLVRDLELELLIFDQSGRLVKTLVDERQSLGKQSVTWDVTDQSGAVVPPGMYSYMMISEGVVVAKDQMIKM